MADFWRTGGLICGGLRCFSLLTDGLSLAYWLPRQGQGHEQGQSRTRQQRAAPRAGAGPERRARQGVTTVQFSSVSSVCFLGRRWWGHNSQFSQFSQSVQSVQFVFLADDALVKRERLRRSEIRPGWAGCYRRDRSDLQSSIASQPACPGLAHLSSGIGVADPGFCVESGGFGWRTGVLSWRTLAYFCHFAWRTGGLRRTGGLAGGLGGLLADFLADWRSLADWRTWRTGVLLAYCPALPRRSH